MSGESAVDTEVEVEPVESAKDATPETVAESDDTPRYAKSGRGADDDFPSNDPDSTEPKAGDKDGEPSDKAATDVNAGAAFEAELVERAKSYGLAEGDLKNFQTPEALEAAMTVIDRRFLAMGQPEPEAEKQAVEAKPEVKLSATEQPSKFELKFSADVDPEVRDQMAEMQKFYDSRLQALEQMYQRAEQAQAQRVHEEMETKFDSVLDGLGANFEAIFGKGEIKPGSEQYKARSEAWQQTKALLQGYAKSGIKASFEDAVKRAVRATHGDKATENAVKGKSVEIAKTLEKRKGAILSRPTQRATKVDKTGKDKAAEFAEKFYAEKGV